MKQVGGAENEYSVLARDVTTGGECYDMHRLIVMHKKAIFCLLCASQSSHRASAIAERYNIVR